MVNELVKSAESPSSSDEESAVVHSPDFVMLGMGKEIVSFNSYFRAYEYDL